MTPATAEASELGGEGVCYHKAWSARIFLHFEIEVRSNRGPVLLGRSSENCFECGDNGSIELVLDGLGKS
jgi:hypothetical protein